MLFQSIKILTFFIVLAGFLIVPLGTAFSANDYNVKFELIWPQPDEQIPNIKEILVIGDLSSKSGSFQTGFVRIRLFSEGKSEEYSTARSATHDIFGGSKETSPPGYPGLIKGAKGRSSYGVYAYLPLPILKEYSYDYSKSKTFFYDKYALRRVGVPGRYIIEITPYTEKFEQLEGIDVPIEIVDFASLDSVYCEGLARADNYHRQLFVLDFTSYPPKTEEAQDKCFSHLAIIKEDISFCTMIKNTEHSAQQREDCFDGLIVDDEQSCWSLKDKRYLPRCLTRQITAFFALHPVGRLISNAFWFGAYILLVFVSLRVVRKCGKRFFSRAIFYYFVVGFALSFLISCFSREFLSLIVDLPLLYPPKGIIIFVKSILSNFVWGFISASLLLIWLKNRKTTEPSRAQIIAICFLGLGIAYLFFFLRFYAF